MLRSLFFILLSLLFIGCSIVGSDCPDSVNLGLFYLKEESKEYFPYSKFQNLLFVDQDGKEHKLEYSSSDGPALTTSIYKQLCNAEPFILAAEYYEHDYQSIEFKNPITGDLLYFRLDVSASGSDDFSDAILYDNLYIRGVFDSLGGQFLTRVIPSYHQDEELPNTNYLVGTSAKSIGDTMVNLKKYSDVYKYKSHQGISMLYNKINGVFYVYDEDGNYMQLKN